MDIKLQVIILNVIIMVKGPEVIGIGSLNYDYIYKVKTLAFGNQQVVINDTISSPGGSAANSIFVLARLGVKTGFLGAVGSDTDGEKILSHMTQVGIDITNVKRLSDQSTAKVLVFVDNAGERAMYSLPGANTRFEISDEDIDYIKNCTYLLISAIPSKDSLNEIKKVLPRLSENVRIVFMPGGLYSALGLAELKQIIERTYILILNRSEFRSLINSKLINEQRISRLIEIGCMNVIVTTGKDGCIIKTDKSYTIIPTPTLPKSLIIDSTGAGDAFTAGIIFGQLCKKSLVDSGIFGNLLARNCIQTLGARTWSIDKTGLVNEFNKFSKEIFYEH